MSVDMPPYANALLHGLLAQMEWLHWNITQETWKHRDPFDLVPGLTYNPYYWGDCTCGFDAIDEAWVEGHHHTKACFHTRYRAETDRDEKEHGHEGNHDRMTAWATANGYVNAPYGMAVYCDCGFDEAYQTWRESHGHDPACPLIQPNFAFKDVEISWYKHPNRGTRVNKSLTSDEWAAWYDRCHAVIQKMDFDFQHSRRNLRPRKTIA